MGLLSPAEFSPELMAASLQTFGSQRLRESGVEIERIDPLAGDTWDQRVTAHKDHSVFHRSAWARVLTETYGHQPFYLRILIHGREAALLPLMAVRSFLTGHRGVSLPFSDFAGPLWTDAPQAPLVYSALQELASGQKWKHFEIRDGDVPPADAKPFRTYQSHQLDLRPGIETIHQGLDPSVRQALRKAERSGIEVTVERSPAAMAQFYQLHARTRRRHGLPPQPLGFFEAIARNPLKHEMGFLVLGKLAGIPVAGAVFLHSGGRAIYKFGASDTAHWSLRPNHAVMWKAICELVGSGCDELQFGRTSPADEGLIRFKLSWGCVSKPLSYFRHNTRANAWLVADHPPDESHPMIFGRLPIACNRLAGRLIYPHLD
jgi:CelD/BcsL family acetyltransferase involved in cellulose biosynthesis